MDNGKKEIRRERKKENIIGNISGSIFGEIIVKDPNGNYTDEQRMLGISFLSSTQRIINDLYTPNYSEVSRILNVPLATLHRWWSDREKIMSQASAVSDSLSQFAARKMTSEVVRLIESLSAEDYEKMQVRDRINLLKTFASLSRLLGGKSTSNIEHHHQLYDPKI